MISSVYVHDSGVTVSVSEQVARKVACESSAVKYGTVRKCLLELSCCSVKRPIESVFAVKWGDKSEVSLRETHVLC